MLTDTRLTLDVYQGGAAGLPHLWRSVPEQLSGVRYLRLGSEDEESLNQALGVLHRLPHLRSLAIRGHCFYDASGDPLPGLLSDLPASVSSLSHLVHLDLSFNQLCRLPACILDLPGLSSLLLCHNRLSALPADVSRLSSLTFLSLLGNELVSLPPGLGHLKALQTLDVSHNLLQQLPDEVGSLETLTKLDLSHNRLRNLPESLGSLLSLRELLVHSNDLHLLPRSLDKLPQLKIDARDNLLGRPPTPPPLPPTPDPSETKIPELHLSSDQHSFSVTSAGCHVFLPGGAELLFPPGCVAAPAELEWAKKRPSRKLVRLEEHHVLLSCPLELLPHEITFLKPVEVCVPYHRSKKREVLVQRFDGTSWDILPTVLRTGSEGHSSHPGGRPAKLACCAVLHFSWFMVVSCPVKDSCSLTAAETLLVSSADPGVKLRFPPDSTLGTRSITLQVLQVSVSEVQALCEDPQASVSPLLCLSQSSHSDFLQPIKVQIPLPPGVTGHNADRSCLHLLHGDPSAQNWTDVTSQVSLQLTHLYAVFYIKNFSWYWLWYTTKRLVCGTVRTVYQKLKQYKVQFLVQQLKNDPSQVALQCLPSSKVDSALQCLSEKYDGPLPSDLCNLLEGEEFFAGFEMGLALKTDSPACLEGRLRFVFCSSVKNMKEVFICTAEGQQETVRGQVSFYRGEVPSDLPEEVARKRKGHENQWLATLPLKLPGNCSEVTPPRLFQPAPNSENNFNLREGQYPPLNLGDPENGLLTEDNLVCISRQIGREWQEIGLSLGLTYTEVEHIMHNNKGDLGAMVRNMLFSWARRQKSAGSEAVSMLRSALISGGRRDLAEEIEDIVNIGRGKYKESLRRVGLEGEASSPGQNTAEG